MKKQLFLFLCVSHYLFSMDNLACVLHEDCLRVILKYCDESTFKKFTATCTTFFREKERIGSSIWYYSLPSSLPQDRFETCTNLLDFYRLEYHGFYALDREKGELYNHPHAQLLANEFYAIWQLHKQEREKTDFHEGLIKNCTSFHFECVPLTRIFTHFIFDRNNPAIKILLNRSEALKKQLAENQEAITSQFVENEAPFRSKSAYDYTEILLCDVCRKDDGTIIMNFLPQDEEGNIEYHHFVYALSVAIFYRNKKLITFLVNKEPNQIEKAREELFMKKTKDSQPSSWQVAEYLFLENYQKVDKDKNQSVRKVCSLAIDKNEAYFMKYMIDTIGASFIDTQFFLKILGLPANESIEIFNVLLSREIKFYDIEWYKILKKIKDPELFNDDNKKCLFDIMSKIYTVTVHDGDHISRLFDKDMSRSNIGTYLKFIFLATIASYFLFLKFHGHLHNGFSSISNA